ERGAAARPDGRSRARSAGRGLALGPAGVGGRGRTRRVAAIDRRQRHADAAAHDHVGGAAPHRARARRRHRRGHQVSWDLWAETEARTIREGGRWRAPRDREPGTLTFASNDYLGLSQHPAVVAAAHAALDTYGAGSGSARLIVGSRRVHGELE